MNDIFINNYKKLTPKRVKWNYKIPEKTNSNDCLVLSPDPEDYKYVFQMDEKNYSKFFIYYKGKIENMIHH